jgi:hypothetical protein
MRTKDEPGRVNAAGDDEPATTTDLQSINIARASAVPPTGVLTQDGGIERHPPAIRGRPC